MNKLKFEKENAPFIAEVAGLSVESLDARLAQLAKDAKAVDDAKDADDDLQAARELAKELGAPYRESKKLVRDKSDFIVGLIQEKGGK